MKLLYFNLYIFRPSFVFGEGLIQRKRRNLYQAHEEDRERNGIGYEGVEGFWLRQYSGGFGIGGAIETSPLFLVKRIRALIASASPDIMLIAYRSSIFMSSPPASESRRTREGKGWRRRGSKSLATIATEERKYISIASSKDPNSQLDFIGCRIDWSVRVKLIAVPVFILLVINCCCGREKLTQSILINRNYNVPSENKKNICGQFD